ncbi:MAG: single-stranded-DNA-specific exonuclease RecJ [Bacteroidota bacterium]
MKQKQWVYQPLPSRETLQSLGTVFKTSTMITTLLWQRGIRTLAQAKAFFNPSLGDLHDPFLMKDMDKAVARIGEALARDESICVYGDYDVDGTTSVALLYHALQQLGAKRLSFYLPDRHKEGYGVSAQGIAHAIEKKVTLLICVDCGTRAVTHLTHAKTHGIDTIICDHHEVGANRPPAFAMLNPKRPDDDYPFKGLSACGIVFKLVQALFQAQKSPLNPDDYLDLVALSIAADIVPMVEENRLLMYHGLDKLNTDPRPGIWALKQGRKQEMPFSVSDVVFGLAPFINAVGRMSHATPAVELLLTEERTTAEKKAMLLQEENRSRKQLDEETTHEALAMAAQGPPSETIVLYKEGWPKGIVGIVAARCVEHYHRPTIILTKVGNMLTGSGRSIPGYNLYDAVHHCAPLLQRYGGHAQAVGLTIAHQDLPSFIQQFEEKVANTLLPHHKIVKQTIDLGTSLSELTPTNCRLIARMAPFGPAYRQPVFATTGVTVHDYHIYQGKHIKIFFKEKDDGPLWDAIGFYMAEQFQQIHTNHSRLDIAYKVSLDKYRGVERIQLTLKDLSATT